MRDQYHEALDEMTDQLVAMSRLVGSMMERASSALLTADRRQAEAVILADEEVDALNLEVELATTELLALQQPVATDLRSVVGAMRMSATLERMGDLAQHIAKTARMRYPDLAVPERMLPQFTEMASLASTMAAKVGEVLATRSVELAHEIDRDDDRMDQLHREVLEILLDGSSHGPISEAVDLTLLGRYYERFADHCVSVARRVIYLVIGERYEGDQTPTLLP